MQCTGICENSVIVFVIAITHISLWIIHSKFNLRLFVKNAGGGVAAVDMDDFDRRTVWCWECEWRWFLAFVLLPPPVWKATATTGIEWDGGYMMDDGQSRSRIDRGSAFRLNASGILVIVAVVVAVAIEGGGREVARAAETAAVATCEIEERARGTCIRYSTSGMEKWRRGS